MAYEMLVFGVSDPVGVSGVFAEAEVQPPSVPDWYAVMVIPVIVTDPVKFKIPADVCTGPGTGTNRSFISRAAALLTAKSVPINGMNGAIIFLIMLLALITC
ncbi:MAG: hypothetical protein P1U34_10325 [Coxiellaceae bacterium]|nr:hypothetical protein [Coxiellaceae bacterium]